MRQATVKAPPAPRQRTKGTLVEPVYVVRLMERIGPSDAARALGTTPGTLHKARNAGLVTMPFEVAARGVCLERGYMDEPVQQAPPVPKVRDLSSVVPSPTSESISLMLVQVPRERSAMLQRAAEALGAIVISHD